MTCSRRRSFISKADKLCEDVNGDGDAEERRSGGGEERRVVAANKRKKKKGMMVSKQQTNGVED